MQPSTSQASPTFTDLFSPAEVEKLFGIFYERINPFIAILDPAIHTPSNVINRCQFMAFIVCAVASRHYAGRPTLYDEASDAVKDAALSALLQPGGPTVDLCQAYIILAVYCPPAKHFQDDKAWTYVRIALRLGVSLNLNREPALNVLPTDEASEREHLNRKRTWLILYNLDRSFAYQIGRPVSEDIKPTDAGIRDAQHFYNMSKFNTAFDLGIVAYTEMLKIVERYFTQKENMALWSRAQGIAFNPLTIVQQTNDELLRFHQEAASVYLLHMDPNDAGLVYRLKLLPLIMDYARLFVFSSALGEVVEAQRGSATAFLVQNCFATAVSVMRTVVEKLGQPGYLRYSPNAHFVYSTYAAGFIFKFLRPEWSIYMAGADKAQAINLVERFAAVLNSPQTSIDDRHIPKLYARFVQRLLESRNSGTESETSSTGGRSSDAGGSASDRDSGLGIGALDLSGMD